MNIVFHVGPHKTGTSYIQKECAERRGELTAAGIMYPTHWNTWLHGHTGLYHTLRQEHYEFFRVNYEQFMNEIPKNTQVVIFSNENLEDLNERAIIFLAEAFKEHKIRIAYYVRNWNSLLMSTFQEEVKHGSFETFGEYAFRNTTTPKTNQLFNYNIVLDRYAKHFGAQNIIVRIYDNLIASNINLFEDLLSQAWQAPSPIKGREYIENPSLTSVETEVVRLLNSEWFVEERRPLGIRIREVYFNLWHTISKERAELAERCRPYLRHFSTTEFMSEFPGIEEQLLKNYETAGPRPAGGLFADQSDKFVEYLSTDFLLDSRCREIIDLIRRVVRDEVAAAASRPSA